MGYVREPRTGATFDGTTLTLSGPTNRTLSTDATGFFGAADLPVGNYLLTLAIPGYRTLTRSFSVTGATVTEPELSLEQIPLQIISAVRGAVGNVLTITWNAIPGRSYRGRIQRFTDVAALCHRVGCRERHDDLSMADSPTVGISGVRSSRGRAVSCHFQRTSHGG